MTDDATDNAPRQSPPAQPAESTDAPRPDAAAGTTLDAESTAEPTAIRGERRNRGNVANLRHFRPGQPSANPSGRPKSVRDVARLARTHTREAIATLTEAMSHPASPWATRVAAANSILDRGHGKAAQVIDLRDETGTPLSKATAGDLVDLLQTIRAARALSAAAERPAELPALDVTPRAGEREPEEPSGG